MSGRTVRAVRTARTVRTVRTVLTTTMLAGALATTLATAGAARASGFLIYDASASALGKAAAVTASVDDPSAVWFNPGALACMPGYGATVGGTVAMASNNFTPADGSARVDGDPGRFFLPAVFAEGALTDQVHVGVAGLTAFGLGLAWPRDWVGRESAIEASIETFTINPTIAVQLTPEIGVGAGFQAVRGAVDFTAGLPALVGGEVRVGGGTWGYGANLGVLVRPLPGTLHLGFSYRSRVKLSFDGRADFDPRPEFAGMLRDQPGSAVITLPDIFAAGIMWRPRPAVTLTFDPNLVLWRTYDRTVLDFQTAPDKVLEHRFHDALTLRAGIEVETTVPGLAFRGGLIYDQNPAPSDTLSPSLPDSHRIDFAVGAGYRVGWFTADLGYLLAYFLPADTAGGDEGPAGTYRTVSHLIGLSVGARLGREDRIPAHLHAQE